MGTVSSTQGYANGRLRREEIVLTAATHFAQRGFAGSTILDIAASCGISRPGLLHHFPDKAALLMAVLEDRDEADRLRFRPYVDRFGAMGVLIGMIRLAEQNRQIPGLIALFARLSSEATEPTHPAHAYFVARQERITCGTTRALAQLQRQGSTKPGLNPRFSAIGITALSDGLQANWLLDRGIDVAAHTQSALLALLSGQGREQLLDRL